MDAHKWIARARYTTRGYYDKVEFGTMATTANVDGATTATKRGAKKPISIDPAAYSDAEQYTLSSVNVPGAVYREMVKVAADNGGAKDGVLLVGRMSIVARAALAHEYAPTFDIGAYEQGLIDQRNAARKTGGSTRSGNTTRKAALLDNILDDDDIFTRIADMKAQGLSKEEIMKALAEA